LFKPYQKLFLVLSQQRSSEKHPFWALTDGSNIPLSCYDTKPVEVNVNTQPPKKNGNQKFVEILTVITKELEFGADWASQLKNAGSDGRS